MVGVSGITAVWRVARGYLSACAFLLLLAPGCRSVPDSAEDAASAKEEVGTGKKPEKGKTKEGDSAEKKAGKGESARGAEEVDVGFLLTMSYNEARKLSPQSIELPPYYKVAADEVTVVSKKADGTPKKIRAKGHVYLQADYRDELNALGQEALISGDEVILRGKPLLRRGRSVVEGLHDRTVFYIQGLRLQVIGLHRVTTEGGVTPSWRGSWKDGPNPLLPALSPEDVPKGMRASPLLPPVSRDDVPKPPR